MRAHPTQILVDGPFFALSNNLGQEVLGVEYYRLVQGERGPAGAGPHGLGGRPVRRPGPDDRRTAAAAERPGAAVIARRRRRAAWLALVEVFWLPLRVGGVLVPVSVVAAVVGNLMLVALALRLSGSRLVAVLPALTWLVVAVGGDGPPSRGRPAHHRRRGDSAWSTSRSCCSG